MSTLRKLERNVVKGTLTREKKSIKRNFADAWNDLRDKKFVIKDEDGNVLTDNTPRNTMKKKQRHFDNVEQYNKLFAYTEALKKEKV